MNRLPRVDRNCVARKKSKNSVLSKKKNVQKYKMGKIQSVKIDLLSLCRRFV